MSTTNYLVFLNFNEEHTFDDATIRKTQGVVDVRVLKNCNVHAKVLRFNINKGSKGVAIWFNSKSCLDNFKSSPIYTKANISRIFEIVEPITQATKEANNFKLEDAKAILLINGQVIKTIKDQAEVWKDFTKPELVPFVGKTYGTIPGVIIKNMLKDCKEGDPSKDRELGGCYLFMSMRAVNDYLVSEVWDTAKKSTPWEDVSIEKYEIA